MIKERLIGKVVPVVSCSQRQPLCSAGSVLSNSSLLGLDTATSTLQTQTEKMVLD